MAIMGGNQERIQVLWDWSLYENLLVYIKKMKTTDIKPDVTI